MSAMPSALAEHLKRYKPAADPSASRLTMVLGPTNTGKTHACISRMLEHESGMLGLPLRLLAREVYDRITAQVGEQRVALVTGEEKRVPQSPDYWICTVEAMPLQCEVDFLAIDEVQLISHPSRGHIFTDRVLTARGRIETWFLGADTARRLLGQMIPAATFESRPRLSQLSFAGSSTLARLPPRSALVAFSAAQDYALAERLRARKGGAAVVLGALSPRTRNAQVAMYQAGEVDYLVATDAIGMGLNLAVDHVAFAARRKFDGSDSRELSAAELGQIAGRAGRHLSNGSFGTLTPCAQLPDSLSQAIVEHRFEPIRQAFWRNSDLCFDSAEALVASLTERSTRPWLRAMHTAEDFETLKGLLSRPATRRLLKTRQQVELLWAACQVPDYRKLLRELHHELVFTLFEQLAGEHAQLKESWARERIERLASTEGDLDTLMGRLAFVRTWTYVSHQKRWLQQARAWQERTREIEDALSDAIHQRLLQRFVESKRSSTSRNARRSGARSTTSQAVNASPIDPTNPFAKLIELQRQIAPTLPLQPAGDEWVARLIATRADGFTITTTAKILFETTEVACLKRGKDILAPELVLADLDLSAGEQQQVRRRLVAHQKDLVDSLFPDLRASLFDGAGARGLIYQLRQGLGTVEVRTARDQLAELTSEDRERLGERGVLFGCRFVLVRAASAASNFTTRAAFYTAYHEQARTPHLDPSIAAVARERGWTQPNLLLLGYGVFGNWVVSCDALEQLLETEALPVSLEALAGTLGLPSDGAWSVACALGARLAQRPRRMRPRRRRGRGTQTR